VVCSRAWTSSVVWLACAFLLASCGEDGDDAAVALGPRPARVFKVSVLDLDQRQFRYGEDISVTFDQDPGAIRLDYAGETPITPLHSSRPTHTFTFLLECSPTVLRWSNGGSLVLEYDPIVMPDPLVPALTKVWPKVGAQHVSYDNINTRTHVNFMFDTFTPTAHFRQAIPRFRVNVARITGPGGETWEPTVLTVDKGFYLLRRTGAPYERAQTYGVHVEVTFVVAPDEPQIYDYQFRIQD
jgi:hypothetical protein